MFILWQPVLCITYKIKCLQYILLFSDLSGACDWLASSVAATNHHLLGEEDLFCGDLDTQVTAGNHDAVAGLHDFVKSTDQTEF